MQDRKRRRRSAARVEDLNAGWSSSVARRAHNPKVAGSNPAPATEEALVSQYGGPGLRRSPARLLTDFAVISVGRTPFAFNPTWATRAVSPGTTLSPRQTRSMAFDEWSGAVHELRAALEPPSSDLLTLAEKLHVVCDSRLPAMWAIAQVEDAVSRVTGRRPPQRPTSRQVYLLGELGIATRASTVREADAAIRIGIIDERIAHLEMLRPRREDALEVNYPGSGSHGRVIVVSSIDRTGMVWARGGNGESYLPQRLERKQ